MPREPIEVDQECLCGSKYCNRWGLSNGTFYQGSGFERSDADRLAACWNALAGIENPTAFVEAARGMMEALDKVMNRHASAVLFHDRALAESCWDSLRAFRAQLGEGQSDD